MGDGAAAEEATRTSAEVEPVLDWMVAAGDDSALHPNPSDAATAAMATVAQRFNSATQDLTFINRRGLGLV